MSLWDIVVISVGVAMDAFAVSICKGLAMHKMDWRKAIIVGLYFGLFQAGMPVIGYFLGATFETLVTSIDHWLAFGLLSFIGGNMIREALSDDEENVNDQVDFLTMLPLAIATSIDALSVGVTFAFLKVNLWLAITFIGVITFAFSACGVKIGNRFGNRYQKKAEITGGVILIFLGIKILLEHLGII